MLPAGVISDVDNDDEKVFVHRTKKQIENAPEFDELPSARRRVPWPPRLGPRPGGQGWGYRDWDDK